MRPAIQIGDEPWTSSLDGLLCYEIVDPLISTFREVGMNIVSLGRAFLFLLGGACSVVLVAFAYAQRSWWVNMRVNGALGFSVTSTGLGPGLLIAVSCPVALLAVGTMNVVSALKELLT